MADDPTVRLNAPVSDAELERRWSRARRAMEVEGVDVLLMQGNNDFMAGYIKWFTDLPATQGYSTILTVPRDAGMTLLRQGPFGLDRPFEADPVHRGIARLLTCPSYASAGYSHDYEAELTANALRPYAKGTIGLVGLSTLSYHLMDALKKGPLAGARIVDASDMIDRIKAVKSPEEVDRMRATATMQDAAMTAAFDAFRPGNHDRDVTAAAEAFSLRIGSEQGLYMCASAPIGSPLHFADRHFQGRPIQTGDQMAILIENNGPGGYYCELGRTAVLGHATDHMQEEFAFVLKARQFMLERLMPGADCAAIWNDYNIFMRDNGKPEEARLHCHGMGYDMVERPLVRFDEPMKLEAGMVVSCHPTYETEGGLHWICDDFLIGADGPERLHEYPEAIVEID